MTSERALRWIVGVFILAGLALIEFHSRNWVYLLVLVGVVLTTHRPARAGASSGIQTEVLP